MNIPYFECDNPILNKAYRLATACIAANTIHIKTGILEREEPCVMAGLDYATPWTRDSAINVMNAVAYLDIDIAKNTLKSVVENRGGKNFIGDQYWDCVIWVLGANKVWEVSRDKEFLKFSFETVSNTLALLEEEEFDHSLNLFRGPAVYGDGVAAYPDKYHNENMNSAIWTWQDSHPEYKVDKGYGLPMMALSTNCLYAEVYKVMAEMAKELGLNGSVFKEKSENMKKAINKHFDSSESVGYDYLYKECAYQEGLGLAFSVLFDIADNKKAQQIAQNSYISNNGIPCVWPSFERYKDKGYGRHSGTVWPHVQGYWAMAMKKIGEQDKFEKELFCLAENAVRDLQFVEIYHPDTGMPYGGVQEAEFAGGYTVWKSCDYQTWSATAFLNMVYEGIFGISVKNGKITYSPVLPKGVTTAKLVGFKIGNERFDIKV